MPPEKLIKPDAWRDHIPARRVVFATTERLRFIVNSHQLRAFVWPDEGEFRDVLWHFNAEHHGYFEPLLVDRISAYALLIVRDALRSDNQQKFDALVAADRGSFALMMEFAWKHTTYKPRNVRSPH